MKVVAISGYKAHELGIFDSNHVAITYIKKAIENRLRPLCEQGLEWVIISGQLGVELWSAEVVFSLKQEYKDLRLAVLTPYLEQESRWKEETQQYYQSILDRADFNDSISKRPYDNPIQLKQKNEFILSKADGIILFYDEENPGSPRFMFELAKEMTDHGDVELIQITAMDMNELIQEEQFLHSYNHDEPFEN
ncbi:DUF1273 domain-containing protein [Halalkalibacter hemicellulosilyticus]|uniref:UPF0398 protein JCM9152_1935 n=1 Tax=Halalkalibacter hemicellulosilyticusJCM 9152 TaxID=1236971 RepID=W4QF25_9BACI|nr:DUF1273 domain-containing protein [Halalkalibacter hemicellulosilyticus]GAE30527.1 hypothetical protein JCM9152_1935 [Halalkalibacter hemicellulosilyticusJCM 9152]